MRCKRCPFESKMKVGNKMSKKEVYKALGIEYQSGKILAPEFGWIQELLVDGNSKLGKGVWTFSTLPTNQQFTVEINGKEYVIGGTCPCSCPGCYATKGNYNFSGVRKSLAIKTYLAKNFPEFVKNAIIAQIKACDIKLCRIHASGDFFGMQYIVMWREIVKESASCVFWTYTKNKVAENAFSDLQNINIVKSIVPGFGFNFGKCEYILKVYNALKEIGKPVYICRCGIDNNQHCTNCKGCSKNEFVLFIEHSTGYNAESDPLFPELKAIIESQAKPE